MFEPGTFTKMVIGGQLVDAESGRSFVDRNPATGEPLTELPEAGTADADRAVEAAGRGLAAWSRMPGRQRGRILNRLADLLEQHRAELALLESQDNGRPIRETTAQAGMIGDFYRYFAGITDKIEGKTIPVGGDYLNYTTRVPVGVCAAITPWNHPQLIAAKKVAPALAAGNSVIVKPSELAPLSVLALGILGLEAGLPDGVLNVMTGAGQIGSILSAHPGIQRVDVTGSTATGIAVATAAAPTMKRLGFELGGKAANVVFEDADLDRAVRGIVFSGFIGQGQTCVAGSRALVHSSIAKRFAAKVAERAEQIRLGNPLDVRTQMGPLITPQAASRVRKIIEDAVVGGVELLAGGCHPDNLDDGLHAPSYLSPTVLWTDDAGQAVAQEEIFGPLVTVLPFDTEDEAADMVNAVRYGLGGAIWTSDLSRAHRMAAKVRAGITWLNDYHRVDPASPWGGFGLSGYGRENGIEAICAYTEVKSTWVPLEPTGMDWYDSTEQLRLN